MQNENENEEKRGLSVSPRLLVPLILTLAVMFLISSIAFNGGGRVNVPFSVEAQDCQASEERMESLEIQLRERIDTMDGKWNIYVKELRHGLMFSINDEPMYAASLNKLYVMESVYAHYDQILEHVVAVYGEEDAQATLDRLLENMIVRSDNDSFNELVSLHSANHQFSEGCELLNAYLAEQSYDDTIIVHTLHPSNYPAESISTDSNALNMTSSMDCGLLLERIYKGDCVSYEASEKMLELLSMQEIDSKIPAGTTRAKMIANKTGETDKQQHDVAIVYTKDRDYILCIMSTDLTAEDEEAGISNVKDVASLVEKTLVKMD